ncbi:MAG: SDR family oxidoreductase [Chloroflexi bacterium]|nr:MAG: SDR family oxidoreductase [Chloroflexota bacterium]
MIIQGKIALVTGGAIRVGKAITLGLAKAGASVAINYFRDAEKAFETAKEVESMGVCALPVYADISDWEAVKCMFDEVHEKLGPVDILVNNASAFKKTPFPTDSIADWQQVTGILINGAFYVSNLAAVDMLQKKEGSIVNILDLTVWEAWPGYAAHVVGKSALLALTRQLAIDLAPYVRVNAVAPGPVLPPADYSPERIERTAAKTLLDRWGTPEDISNTVNFLIESDYINADVIAVDGGERFGHRKKEAG